MDYRALGFWTDIAWKAGTVVTLLYALWTNRVKADARRFEALESKVKTMASSADLSEAVRRRDEQCLEHFNRTRNIENALLSMPSRSELSGLSQKMDALTHNIGRLEGRLEGINRVADLMNEFLINQGGKT